MVMQCCVVFSSLPNICSDFCWSKFRLKGFIQSDGHGDLNPKYLTFILSFRISVWLLSFVLAAVFVLSSSACLYPLPLCTYMYINHSWIFYAWMHIPVCVLCCPYIPLMCLSLSPMCACASQPPVEGRPSLPITDFHRDWQFRWHDLRPQHSRLQLLRRRWEKLRRRWWWRLRLRRWEQKERQRNWFEASQKVRWRDAQMAPLD